MTHEDAMTLLQELTSEDCDKVTHAVLVALPLKVVKGAPDLEDGPWFVLDSEQ